MKNNLDRGEKEILESFNNNEWEKVEDHEPTIKRFERIANNTL